MPRESFGYFYPYDWMFPQGQYPPRTYTHFSSSFEPGSADWQENSYLRYEMPNQDLEIRKRLQHIHFGPHLLEAIKGSGRLVSSHV
ncbi:unnamed protein product [Lota lota]